MGFAPTGTRTPDLRLITNGMTKYWCDAPVLDPCAQTQREGSPKMAKGVKAGLEPPTSGLPPRNDFGCGGPLLATSTSDMPHPRVEPV